MCIPVNDSLEVTAKAIEVLTAKAIRFEAWHVTHEEERRKLIAAEAKKKCVRDAWQKFLMAKDMFQTVGEYGARSDTAVQILQVAGFVQARKKSGSLVTIKCDG